MTKCPKCSASTDGAFCGVCGTRVQAATAAVPAPQQPAAEYLPLAIVTVVPTLGSLAYLTSATGIDVFLYLGLALVGLGGLLITVTGALNVIAAESKRSELTAVLVVWSISNFADYIASIRIGANIGGLCVALLWFMTTSFAALSVRERLLAGEWLPTTKTAKGVAVSIVVQTLVYLVVIIVVNSRTSQ